MYILRFDYFYIYFEVACDAMVVTFWHVNLKRYTIPTWYGLIISINHLFLLFSIEIQEFKTRRIAYFKKHLVEVVELEVKHAKVSFFDYILKEQNKV